MRDGIVHFKLHEEKLEEFKRLSAACMEIVRAQDPGTLQYDTYLNEDETEAVVHVCFRDSESLIAHSTNLSGLMDGVMDTGSISGYLLGDPSPELRALLTGDQPRLFAPYQLM